MVLVLVVTLGPGCAEEEEAEEVAIVIGHIKAAWYLKGLCYPVASTFLTAGRA